MTKKVLKIALNALTRLKQFYEWKPWAPDDLPDDGWRSSGDEGLRAIAAIEKAMQEQVHDMQEPVFAQSRFIGSPWSPCAVEHARMVLENPNEWKDYEVRFLFAASQARQQLTDEQIARALAAWFSPQYEYNSSMETRMRAAIEAAMS